MAHPRVALRQAIVDALRAAFAASPEVEITDENPRTLNPPSVQVLVVSEAAQSDLGGGFFRQASVSVVLRAKGPKSPGQQKLQDALDVLAETAEAALLGIRFDADGGLVGITYQSMELEVDAGQSDRVGTMTLTFQADFSG